LKNKQILWTLLRIGLGLLFVAASYYKLLSPGAFAHQIYNYKILPPWAVNPLAITLPWVQLFCGLALIFNKFRCGASLLIVLMLFAFQAAVASALIRGLNISCGCFKSGGSPATWLTFSRDLLLLVAGIVQMLDARRCHKEAGLCK
jgi:uncharacterized membrane protein YphA (DoxX/SURF4 family)